MEGGTSFPMYDGKELVSSNSGIVLVMVNYRLGLLGMLDLSEVEGGEKYPDSGKLILLDQIEALKWVKRNIAGFGGDADRVTIGGDSYGANCALLLPLIDSAKGLFNQVVAFSPGGIWLLLRSILGK